MQNVNLFVRLKFQERNEMDFLVEPVCPAYRQAGANQAIPIPSEASGEGIIPRRLRRKMGPRLALGFIPVIYRY
jgi:hypothetical protein